MYGLNEIDIQFYTTSPIQMFDRIHFKLMINKITDPNFDKIIDAFCGLRTILKCIIQREKNNLLIKIEYKFNTQIVFYNSFNSSEL
jgi:hypothetical protein